MKSLATRIRAFRPVDDTIRRHGGHGDNWYMTWARDDFQYACMCDGAGFTRCPSRVHNSRMLRIKGGPEEPQFLDIETYPLLAEPPGNRFDTRYYNFGTLAIDGCIYQFLSTFNRIPHLNELEGEKQAHELLRFNGVKLIYSPDDGRTWNNQDGSSPVTWPSWTERSKETMLFLDEEQESFSLISVLQMGKNYEHNRDGFVYVYAPNGNTDGTMNELVMFRVPKTKLLHRSCYEYFGGFLSSGRPRWRAGIEERRPVHIFPRGWVNKLVHPYSWQPSIVYNAALELYMMTAWGMGTGRGVDGWSGLEADSLWFTKPSYLGFWIASTPWGPWWQVYENTAWTPGGDENARAYQPQIAPKWVARDGRSFWLVWTDFQILDKPAMQRRVKELLLESKARGSNSNVSTAPATASMMLEHMPYYAFNVQRVDLEM